MAIKKIKLPGMAQPVDIGTTWTNISGKPDLITNDEAAAYMQKGVDYVTAGQNSESSLGLQATAEGYQTTASGDNSHAEGVYTMASGDQSHAEGQYTAASNHCSHAEGNGTAASGSYSHAEGQYTAASGEGSHAEGSGTIASGYNSHAEGEASAFMPMGFAGNAPTLSKVEGQTPYQYQLSRGIIESQTGAICVNNKLYVITAIDSTGKIITLDRALPEEGSLKATYKVLNPVISSGPASHAEGIGTIANHASQHVFGEYNIADGSATTNRGNYVEIVGNGSSKTRSNARTLDWNGNEVLAGKLTVGANPTENMDVATKQYVDNNFIATTLKGVNNGIAELDAYGKIPTAQLPSYVDDVVEGTMSNGVFTPNGNGETANPDPIATGESGKIYVDTNTNKTYRWGGTTFVEISESLALGETSSTAYAGNKGKEAHDLASAALPMTGGAMSGDIAMGNHKVTNLANGEVVTDAATVGQLISLIQHQTATIGTDATSAVINLGSTYTCINAYATIGNERVLVDIEVNEASGIVTFSTAQEPPSAITCHVFYFLSVLPTTTTIPDPSGGEIIAGD